jgi:hypothetical protein
MMPRFFALLRTKTVRRSIRQFLMVLFLLLTLVIQPAPSSWAADYPIIYTTFVGNKVVDLIWSSYGGYHYYRVLRDGREVFRTTNLDELWYRDGGVAKGTTYTYMLCVGYDWGEEYCGNQASATVGEVRGNIFQDLSWDGGVYELHSDVHVRGTASLTIDGATVQPAEAIPIIATDTEAILEISGATLHVPVNLSPAGGHLVNSTLLQNAGLIVRGNATITGNQFRGGSVTLGYSAGPADIVVADNDFYGSEVQLWAQSTVEIRQNRFYEGAQIETLGESNATIVDNTFFGDPQQSDAAVKLLSPGSAVVRLNRFRNVSGGVLASASSHARIEQNVFQGPSNAADTTAIHVQHASPPTTTQILIQDNIISGWDKGIYADECAVQIDRNKIVNNGVGIQVDGNGACTIQQSCIGGNQTGLQVAGRTEAIAAAHNYWGAPSGPTHPDNPAGQGDSIVGGPVTFVPWLLQGDCATQDLGIAGLEVVQVVQDLPNSVPLVAGKKTIVRVYADSAVGTIAGVTGELTAYREGQLLGTRAPDAPIRATPIIDINAKRAQKNGGLLFRLPPDWITGTVTLTVVLESTAPITETSLENNIITMSVFFEPREAMRLAYVPIGYQPDPAQPAQLPDLGEMLSLHTFMQEIYPLAEVVPEILGTLPWYLEMAGVPPETEIARGDVLLDLLTFFYLEANAGRPDALQLDQIVGVFPNGAISYAQADPRWDMDDNGRGGQGRAVYCDLAGSSLAHEIGHNLGLRHPGTPDACNAQDPQSYWPAVYADATMQEYGYNFILDTVVGPAVPNRHLDLMTYCVPVWVSPLHYRMLYNADLQPQAVPGGTIAQEENYIVAAGRVDDQGAVEFLPFWQISSTVPLGNPPAGEGYCLELRDGANAVLQGHCFNLDFFNYQGYMSMTVDSFVVALPLDPATTRVVLRQGALDLGQVTVSAHAPTVTVQGPNGGETATDPLVVTWTATDLDGDELAYQISYSADDGATWLPLAVNLTGTMVFSAPLALLPGSTSAGVRVRASDGFHTAADMSDGPFSVGQKAPVVSILHPVTASNPLLPLTLQGAAYDLEDGFLEGDALSWYSDRDGALGTGSELRVEVLSPGWHTLTLTATDSQANSTSVVVVFRIGRDIYLPLVVRGG